MTDECYFNTKDSVKVSRDYFVLEDCYNAPNKNLFNKCLEAKNNDRIKDFNYCSFSRQLNDGNKVRIYQIFSTEGLLLSNIFLVINEDDNSSNIYVPWVDCSHVTGISSCISYVEFEQLFKKNCSLERFGKIRERLYKCFEKNNLQMMRFEK